MLLSVHRERVKMLILALIAGTMLLSACGGGSSGNDPQTSLTLSGNWQFTMGEQLNPDSTKPSFTGGLQGGFLLQANGSVSGSVVYSIMTDPPFGSGGTPTECDSGIDQITGTVTGQSVSLVATSQGGQTFTLSGTLSFDGSTMVGSYTSTDGAGCGIAATQNWNATLVPSLTGLIQGTFHSSGGAAGLNEQDFLVTGLLTQGTNTGASSSTVTGTLASAYPCFAGASVTGEISGNSVYLQIMGADGSNIGQIGQSNPAATSGTQAVTYISTQNGYTLQSLTGIGYAVYAAACGGGSLQSPADSGYVCLAVNSTTACEQPITLSPDAVTFPAQAVGSHATTQALTLANTYGSILGGLTVAVTNNSGGVNFSEKDNCGLNGIASQGGPFTLLAQQMCVITIAFAPQESCNGSLTAQCLAATLAVTSPNNDAIVTVDITGTTSDASATSKFNSDVRKGLDWAIPRQQPVANQPGLSVQTLTQSHGTLVGAEID